MQKVARRYWLVLWLLAVGLLIYPINNEPLRIAIIGCITGGWAGCLWSFWNRKPVFYGLLALLVLISGFLACPGRNPEPEKLREANLAALKSYTGTPYLWGGEGKRGIDCSGLIRAGLIKANFEQGCYSLNPALVRFAISLWWHDCSAKALGEEYRGQTKHITAGSSINDLDGSHLQPGDMAVTKSGVHVLAFLGGEEWIEADPHFGKVIMVTVPAPKNPWFEEPVNIMRWTELETK